MKIIHISDLHFGYHREDLITVFLQEMEIYQPDMIIISGDLTHRAKHHQYQQFSAFLKKLPGHICVVPGNHDIPLHNVWMRYLFPFKKYERYVSQNLNVAFNNDHMRLLGVNSTNPHRISSGILSLEILQIIKDYFKDSFDGINLLFFHHNFDYMAGWHKPLENYQLLLNYLKDSQIDIVCTGHLHYANINFIQKNNEKSCILMHSGSLSCQRSKDGLNSYFELNMQEKRYGQIHWRVFENKKFQMKQTWEIDFESKKSK